MSAVDRLFPVITSAQWRDALALARLTPNSVQRGIALAVARRGLVRALRKKFETKNQNQS